MAAVIAALETRTPWAVLTGTRVQLYLRAAVGAGILVAIGLEVGAEPFLRGLASVSTSPTAILAALALGAIATLSASWRWRTLAGRLGLPLGTGESVAAYYRSQFLNSVLPGGVVGDVHRAVLHGRRVSHLPQASRAVVAERAAGQTVQLAFAAVLLVLLGMSAYAPAVGIVLVGVAVACAGLAVAAAASLRVRAAIAYELATVRLAFGSLRTVGSVIVASTLVIAGHVATFIVACLAVGVEASPGRLVAIALIAVIAGSIPLNIGGWGPREGAAAWAFATAGLGAATGIAASTAFGVLALIAVAPGAAVVAASALRRRRILEEAEQEVSP